MYTNDGFIMLKLIKVSSNKKVGPCATTYRAGANSVYATCPSTCELKPEDQAGSTEVDREYLTAVLNSVPRGGKAWTYTHFPKEVLPAPDPAKTCVNVSTENIASALDSFRSGHPTVVVRPYTEEAKVDRLEDGTRLIRCPAEYTDITCFSCGNGNPLCARHSRNYIIKFLAHGVSRKKIMMRVENPGGKSGGCYGSSGPVHLQWKNSIGTTENDSELLSSFVRRLPYGTLLRHHVVGDFGSEE